MAIIKSQSSGGSVRVVDLPDVDGCQWRHEGTTLYITAGSTLVGEITRDRAFHLWCKDAPKGVSMRIVLEQLIRSHTLMTEAQIW